MIGRIMCANERMPCTRLELRRHHWVNTYMRSLMKIRTFATRLIKDDKLTDGCVQDRGSYYLVTLDVYVEY